MIFSKACIQTALHKFYAVSRKIPQLTIVGTAIILSACSSRETEVVDQFRAFEVINEKYVHEQIIALAGNYHAQKFRDMILAEMKKNLPVHDNGSYDIENKPNGAYLVFTTNDATLWSKVKDKANEKEGAIYPLPGGSEMRKHIDCTTNNNDSYKISMPLRTSF